MASLGTTVCCVFRAMCNPMFVVFLLGLTRISHHAFGDLSSTDLVSLFIGLSIIIMACSITLLGSWNYFWEDETPKFSVATPRALADTRTARKRGA